MQKPPRHSIKAVFNIISGQRGVVQLGVCLFLINVLLQGKCVLYVYLHEERGQAGLFEK